MAGRAEAAAELHQLLQPGSSSVSISSDQAGGLCLRAARPLAAGEVALELPTVQSVTQLPDWASDEPALRGPAGPMRCGLLQLLLAAAPEAIPLMAAYYKSLPCPAGGMAHLPVCWPRERCAKLGPAHGPVLRQRVECLEREAVAAVEALRPLAVRLGLADLADLDWVRWGFCVLHSRSLGSQRALVPLLDLMNHAESGCVEVCFVESEGSVCARTMRAVAEGEELNFRYQSGADWLDWLFYYGFVPPEAIWTVYYTVEFQEEVDPDGALGQAISSMGLPATRALAVAGTLEQPVPPVLMWLLRLEQMALEGDEQGLRGFGQGQVTSTESREQAVQVRLVEMLKAAQMWFDKASPEGEVEWRAKLATTGSAITAAALGSIKI